MRPKGVVDGHQVNNPEPAGSLVERGRGPDRVAR